MTPAPAIPEKHDGELGDRSSVRLWLRLLSCTMAIEKQVQRRLAAQFDTTLPRFDVMAALDRRGEGMTKSELSRALLVSNGNVTAIVRKLAQSGHVSVAPLPSDRRASLVRLTPAGRRHFGALASAHHDWIDELLAGLAGPERRTLFQALGRLKQSLEDAQRKAAQ
ncbi:MAG TPA: MarR family transcriptional regulator [Sphingomicrobium sp.]|nr:MarR family transcriptional regulator [Sphingomicrobium sp.]